MRRRTVVVLNLLVLVSKLAVAQSRVPLTFEPNLGQANTAAEFVAHTPQCAAQFDPSGVTLRRGGDTIRMAFGNANPATRLRGLGPTGGSANYFIGPKANWIGGIPLYRGSDTPRSIRELTWISIRLAALQESPRARSMAAIWNTIFCLPRGPRYRPSG